jgi:hypothetical protein
MFYVPPERIDEAWSDGAHQLSIACEKADGDVTPAQLLEALKRGEKTLLGHAGAWAVVEIQVYPNRRVLHVDAIHAPGVATAEVFDELKAFARHNGCNAIQGACQPAVARLWKRKFGFKPTYEIVRFHL